MEILAPAAALAFVINKVMDWLKDLIPDRLESEVLNPLSWLIGMAVVLAFSKTDFAAGLSVGDKTLATVNVFTLLVIGFMSGAAAGVLDDIKPNKLSPTQMQKAVDQADTLVVQTDAPTPPPPLGPTPPKTTKRTRKQ